MTKPVFDSGVGGARCDDCGETTVVRYHHGDLEWLCRACVEGYWDQDDDEETPDDCPNRLHQGPASTG